MKKTLQLGLLCFITLIPIETHAQWEQTNGPLGAEINSVSSCRTANGITYLFAATRYGGIFRSSDSGENWISVNPEFYDLNVSAIAAVDSVIFAGTTYGDIFLSTDYGLSWRNCYSWPTSEISSFTIADSAIFSGSSEGIVRSTDQGLTWQSALTNEYILSLLSVMDTSGAIYIYAGTFSSGVLISSDYGSNWYPSNEGLTTDYIFSFCYAENSLGIKNIFAGTLDGVFISTNNGVSWSNANGGISSPWIVPAIAAAPDGINVLAVYSPKGIYRTTNAGVSWVPVNYGLKDSNATSLNIFTDETGNVNILAGTKSVAFVSTNFGAKWDEKKKGMIGTWVTALSNGPGNIVLAGTEYSGVFVTENEGNTWTPINEGLNTTFSTVGSFTTIDTNIFAGIFESGLFRSTNLGGAWASANGGTLSGVSAQAFYKKGDTTYLFAGEQYPYNGVYLSTDNGLNWTLTTAGWFEVTAFAASKDKDLFAGTQNGIYLTTDEGGIWIPVNNGIGNVPIRAIAISDTNIFASTEAWFGGIFLSTNKGETWTPINNGIPPNKNIFSLIVNQVKNKEGCNDVFASVWGEGIYFSADNGGNWKRLNTGLDPLFIKVLSISDNYLYAGTMGRGIWRFNLDEITSSNVETYSDQLKYAIYQNFPNPFNPVTTIRFEIPQTSSVQIKIYDVLGKEITVLLNEEMPPGNYSKKWDAGNYPSGVYFYQLRAGSFVETKKMILMK